MSISKRRFLPLAYTERIWPSKSETGLGRRAQRAREMRDVFPKREPVSLPLAGAPIADDRRPILKEEIVRPYSRQGRRVSGYRRARYEAMQEVAGHHLGIDVPICFELPCKAPVEELQIAHLTPDEFSSYAARSGHRAYQEWMKHVKAFPYNYALYCPLHHGKKDCRIIPSPNVHRKRR